MDDSPFVFEISDWKQRTVRLSRKTYQIHCIHRPETALYLQEAQQVIVDPDVVLLSDKGATLSPARTSPMCSLSLSNSK
jgi:hypothetical protein